MNKAKTKGQDQLIIAFAFYYLDSKILLVFKLDFPIISQWKFFLTLKGN